MGSGILEPGDDYNPIESPPSRDYFPDYIVTVIVPLILAIILCLLLAYIMCGRREGVYVSGLTLKNKMFDNVIVIFQTDSITPHSHIKQFAFRQFLVL